MRCVCVYVLFPLFPIFSLGLGFGPYTVKPIEEVVKELGYPVERHDFVTPDGYVLTYHRIPYGRNSSGSPRQPRRVILFMNGILLSSASSMTNWQGISYQLADAGFDVWLGNYRGNTYSRRHLTLNPDRDESFWNISLHEFGAVDLPTAFDYILAVTGQQRLVYVGASMGTTMFWVLGAYRPEYMDKVVAMVAIAPVARPMHTILINTPAKYQALHTALTTAQSLGYKELFSYNPVRGAIVNRVCTSSWLRPACQRALSSFGVISGQNWDIELILEAMKYGPSGIPARVLEHFMQIAKARRFQRYDYGPEANQLLYLQDTPPEYNLKNVTCRTIYFINSDADEIATKEDVKWLTEQLPKKPTRIFTNVNHLGHLGLGLDKGIREMWIKPMVKFLRQFLQPTDEEQRYIHNPS